MGLIVGRSNGNAEAPEASLRFDALEDAPATGSLDEIFVSNGFDRQPCDGKTIVVPSGGRLLLRGWAANHRADGPSSDFHILVDGRPAPATYGTPREDVATVLARTSLTATGFRVALAVGDLAPGPHEVRIRTHDDGTTREIACLRFEVASDAEALALRRNAPHVFSFVLEAFHGYNCEPAISKAIERRYVAVVRGRLREHATNASAATVVGVIDGFDAAVAQAGYGSEAAGHDAFVLCFATDELSFGPHTLDIIATNALDEISLVASLPFTITPLCCGAPFPIDNEQIADAEVAFLEPPVASFGSSDAAVIRGWAIDPVTREAPGAIFLDFADGRSIRLSPRQRREDIAREKHAPAARDCGFVGSVAFATFAPGTHVGRIVIESKDETRRHRSNGTLAFGVSS